MKTKICCKCNRSLSLENFYAQKQGKYGKSTICKECKAEYSRSPERKAYLKKYRKSVKGQLGRRKEIAKRFNITLGEYDQMFVVQEGKCGICGELEVGAGCVLITTMKLVKCVGCCVEAVMFYSVI